MISDWFSQLAHKISKALLAILFASALFVCLCLVSVSCVCVLCLWPCELFLRLTVPVRVCLIASRVAIHASTTLAMRWPLPSLADDRPPHVCGLSPLRVVNDPTGHVPARLSPCHFRGSVVATMAPTGRILHPCR